MGKTGARVKERGCEADVGRSVRDGGLGCVVGGENQCLVVVNDEGSRWQA